MTENKQYLHFQLFIFHLMSFPVASVLLQMTEYHLNGQTELHCVYI